MTNLFKNKKVISCVLAFAILAVSLFTGVAATHIHADAAETGTVDMLEFGDYLINDLGSTSKWYDTVLADNGETGADWDNAIIIDTAEEFVYLCKAAGDETKGKYYKVADGIAGFNLANANLDVEGTLADNLDVILSAGKNHAGSPAFQGYFDGNGVTVYGAWTNHTEGNVSSYAGLFTTTKGEIVIKNIHVKLASFTATNAAGGIVGYHNADSMCTVTIENCSVTDSHLEVTKTGYGCGVGAILGFGASAPSWKEADKGIDGNGDGDMVDTIYVNVAYNIKNCYVNLDEQYFVSKGEDGVEDSGERVCHGGVMGVLGSNTSLVSNCVVIGITPYATMEGTSANDVQHSGLEQHFANIYTTEDVAITDVNLGGAGALVGRNFTDKVFPLTDAQLKGAAAVDNMNLDWSIWMADDTDYPQLRNAHKNITFHDNEDGTHAEFCECGFGGVRVDHIWVNNECACGAELNCAGRETIYWDGTVGTGIATGTGAKDDPYIIKTAAEFAWLIQQKADVTAGKYYEIDQAIGTIVLQPEAYAEDIIALADSAAVKAYFEANAANMKSWPNVGWEGSCFAGQFEGNGATVYGLYQVSANNAGLFSTIDGGVAIKNIALKNSYLTSTATNYQVGGLAAVTSNGGYGAKLTGALWFESCVVANNYMYNPCDSHDRTGAIIGASSDVVYIDNCLVYGNDVSYGNGSIAAGIWSSGHNSSIVSDSFVAPEGLVLEDDGAETPRYYNKVRNSVIFGTKPYDLGQGRGSRYNDPKCYTNVLTDADVATDTFGGTDKVLGATEEQIKTITLADLATIELGDNWIVTDTYPELRSFHDEVFGDAEPNGATGHSAACSCGVKSATGEAHKFVSDDEPAQWDSYYCEVCGYVCEHEKGKEVNYDGDCVTQPGYTFDCPTCGYHEGERDDAFGHSFEEHEAKVGADCQTAGTIAYKYCSACEKNYAADAGDFEPFENAITDLTGEMGACVPAEDENGLIYLSDGTYHWTICDVCEGIIEKNEHTGETTANGVEGHSFKCDVCLNEADNAEHGFGGDNKCDTCGWTCEDHVAGEMTVENNVDKTCTEDGSYDEVVRCTICNSVVSTHHVVVEAGHEVYWTWPENEVPACTQDGSYDEVGNCVVCEEEVRTHVEVPKKGHDFGEVNSWDADCMSGGMKEYKLCHGCYKYFEPDADIYSEDAYESDHFATEVDPDAHNFDELVAEVPATCEKDGVMSYKVCTICGYAVSADGSVDGVIEVNTDDLYAAYEVELAPYQEAINNANSMEEYFAAQNALNEAQAAIYDRFFAEAAAKVFAIEGGHSLVEKDEVAATYEADGTKAHWACENCDKLFSDAEGKNEVTAESLVIAKLVKEEEKPADKPEDKPEEKPEGDDSDKSPATGESVASVAAVAALMGAAFVLVRKSKKA